MSNGVPLIGQQDRQLQAYYFGLYASLVPVVAQARLRVDGEDWNESKCGPEAIAAEAMAIAQAAMKQIGVTIQ